MATFRADHNQTWNADGLLLSDVEVQVDVTTEVNEQAIRDAARLALTANRSFLALSSPTNAQNAAQIKALTRQNQGVIRLLLGALEATD
jgi:hypothetical protein